MCLFVALLHRATAANPSTQWQTLSGNAPIVIAPGGFSAVFPEYDQYVYQFAPANSVKNVVSYCDLQLTKDGAGILIQSVFARPSIFDACLPISMVQDVVGLHPSQFWINVHSFDSGILVPKSYIWPVNEDQYLQAHTSFVTDAHVLGLEVYASDFSNDSPGSYNYSFDPTVEYLQFIDNSNFSVDGVLIDFSSTTSEAISFLAHNNKSTHPGKDRALVITHNGASGIYAGSTDLAYQQAVEDGADVIDCSVQMSKDGVAFCLGSADIMGHTTAVKTFMPQGTLVPEIQKSNGIFSFDLSWRDIQCLKRKKLSSFLSSLVPDVL
ncbi:hypothetical protein ZIOFF_075612 [Zingiber officinale]|uniref:glycerophosphodiester phosphodiesterase n=1 Tax=Zingiber officinale TaxID=94328 RepID=A0A8J5C4A4_ZINOF|nr:hypothetical protein ZIOFF_075612 [Zingiber officinale]